MSKTCFEFDGDKCVVFSNSENHSYNKVKQQCDSEYKIHIVHFACEMTQLIKTAKMLLVNFLISFALCDFIDLNVEKRNVANAKESKEN